MQDITVRFTGQEAGMVAAACLMMSNKAEEDEQAEIATMMTGLADRILGLEAD